MNDKNIEDYRENLRYTITNKTQTVNFRFISKFDQDSDLWNSEEYKNEGIVIIKDLVNEKTYKSSYELRNLNDRIIFEIKFQEFALTSNGPFMSSRQGSFIGSFSDVYDQIKEFPSFSREKGKNDK